MINTCDKYRWSISEVLVKCRLSIGQASVKYRWNIGHVSINYRSSIGHVSVKWRSYIGQVSVMHRSRIGRVSTVEYCIGRLDYRPIVGRQSTDIAADISTEATYSTHDPIYLAPIVLYVWMPLLTFLETKILQC